MKVKVLIFMVSLLGLFAETRPGIPDGIETWSPDGRIAITVFGDADNTLGYNVLFKNTYVIQSSLMGITIDGAGLGEGIHLGKPDRYTINETFAMRGIVHSTVHNHCSGTRIPVTHIGSETVYTLDIRVYNDGIAFRYEIPGKGSRGVSAENTSFLIPDKSRVWYHDFHMHYEGQHTLKLISGIGEGEWGAPPITFRLPGNQGFASITESAIINYPGMGLQADGNNAFHVRLGHEQPVSYPYELRYSQEDIQRLAQPASIEGTIKTPWRVVMIADDLNALVNCDIVYHVAPPPDPTLFPRGFNEDWLKPGRAVWGYLTGEPRTLEGMKNLSRLAGELGFEYHIVEGHWARWTFEEQKELVDYSRQQHVGILLWKHVKDLRDPEKLQEFFKFCHDLGAAGAKIDFFDHEAREVIDLYRACLGEAARYHLILDFHGANKPAGEGRTWPNEMAREAIKGFETRGPFARHNVTLPFTRMLAGHADYTPMHFGDRRCETSEAHQIASAIVLTAPLLVYAEHPEMILRHPAAGVIKQIPSVWDETIVLPCSEIGEISAFAKRSGDRWFLSVMNGEQARIVKTDLSFLGDGDHRVTLIRDERPASAMASLVRKRQSFGAQQGVIIDSTAVKNNDAFVLELIPGGGFVAIFEKLTEE